MGEDELHSSGIRAGKRLPAIAELAEVHVQMEGTLADSPSTSCLSSGNSLT